MNTSISQSHDEIAALAHQFWEQEGRQAGHDLEYWLKAEHQFRSGEKATTATTAASSQKSAAKKSA